MYALYAFMRHTDDLSDNGQPVEIRRESLNRWRKMLVDALEIQSSETNERFSVEKWNSHDDVLGESLLPALAGTVYQFGIPSECLFDVVDGVEMDLEDQRFETFEDLTVYCHRVASAVGLACIRIWGFHGDRAGELARKCGIAMQLTNILRDVKEDLDNGRIYLPLKDFASCGYSVEELERGAVNEGFRRLIELQANRAQQYYHEGACLLGYLEPDGKKIFGMMMSVYHRLLERVRESTQDLLERRIRLSRGEKIRIGIRWMCRTPQRTSLP